VSGIRLIVGLNNPGAQYEKTRHNAGAWFVSQLAHQIGAVFSEESKFFGSITKGSIEQQPVYLLLPQTFMNLSGQSVLAVAQFYKIPSQEILIVHDEIDFPAGTVRLKLSGGAGGHNGIRDVASRLSTPDFWRLRIGVGHPGNSSQVESYVLQKPTADQQRDIDYAIEQSLSIIPDLIQGNFEEAMLKLHSE